MFMPHGRRARARRRVQTWFGKCRAASPENDAHSATTPSPDLHTPSPASSPLTYSYSSNVATGYVRRGGWLRLRLRLRLRSAVCGLRSAAVVCGCGLRSVVCGLRSAVCGLRSAVCGLRSAVCGLRSAVCGLRSAVPVTLPTGRANCALRVVATYFAPRSISKRVRKRRTSRAVSFSRSDQKPRRRKPRSTPASR
ncbi:hypothetical protein SAMN05192539_1003165 [Paraburkholderia diazotrophica]|uniref:Uncharacterized protein n=1 Tax=Paraburkholderia diazotrophica TaxID=667676 RepID=A0A1H6SBL5_9BURK|nr:hypothetical protein SAMN05192539_1003165 [Paraburkholderia diazotrophica]